MLCNTSGRTHDARRITFNTILQFRLPFELECWLQGSSTSTSVGLPNHDGVVQGGCQVLEFSSVRH